MRKHFVGPMIMILAICLTISIANADITSDLVGYWPLDGDASDAAGDSDGVVMGDPTWEAGRKGQAINLDGEDDYVNLPDFSLVTNTVTFACWINGWKTTDWTGILCTRHPGDSQPIEVDGTGSCDPSQGIRFGGNDAIQYEWTGTWGWGEGPVMPENEWAFVAGVIEPNKATLYLYTDANGLESAEREFDHPESDVTYLRIGFDPCTQNAPGPYGRIFKGLIDDARIYNRALSEDEIQALVDYESTEAVKPAGKLTTTWGTIKH